jgi:ankyrin repeat protein
MPTSLAEKLSPEGLRATLIHELAHIKRGDLWINSVQTFLQVVYFYNPFVWFANSIIRKVCEEAVDETVLVALGGEAKHYSNTLIDISEMVFWKADLGLRLIGVAESKKALQWRIRHMLNRPIPKSSKLGALGIAILLIIAALLLPMAKAQKLGEHKEPVASENEQKPAKTLHQAAEDGDSAEVKRLIAQGADVNASDQEHKDKVTPLCVAAGEGYAEIVKILLERGANVDANDSHGYTPLFYAIWSEDEQTVRNLISADANVNVEPKDDVSPLYYAVWQDHVGIVRVLLDAGAKARPEDFRGWSPFQFALEQGNPAIVTLLANTDDKEPSLHKSALRGDLSGLKQQLEKGAEIDQKDGMGRTPIYYALAGGQSETAKFLLDRGASMNLKTETQRTLLHQASRAGLLDIVRLLIARNMHVDAVSRPQNTPLHEAAGAGHKEIVELLISKGASIDSRAGGNRTPLYMAATFGKAGRSMEQPPPATSRRSNG